MSTLIFITIFFAVLFIVMAAAIGWHYGFQSGINLHKKMDYKTKQHSC